MRMRRCTRGLFAAFLILITITLLLDEPGMLLISLSIGVTLAGRYGIFIGRVHKIASSVKISRSPEKHLTRQGSPVGITTTITLMVEDQTECIYSDKIPEGMITGDEPKTGIMRRGEQSATFSYKLTPIMHGNYIFPGGLLTVRDLFFEMDIRFSRDDYTGPGIRIQPIPFLEKASEKSTFGGLEVQRHRSIRGSSVRLFREYVQGDEYRHIDWKMSAKYNSLYIREFTGMEDYPPLIIADLPDYEDDYDTEEFTGMISSITGLIEKSIHTGGISLLVISGPNVIRMISDEYDWSRYMTIIRELLHPQVRFNHLYRTKRRSDIREQIRKIREGKRGETRDEEVHLAKLSSVYHHHLLDTTTTRFSSQISRIFQSIRTNDIYLYSLCDRDISHIQEIAVHAEHQKVRFLVRTPAINDQLRMKKVHHALRGEIIRGLV